MLSLQHSSAQLLTKGTSEPKRKLNFEDFEDFKMTEKVYGRRFHSLDKYENMSANNSIIECQNSLIFRTIADRPSNEDRIRGMW